ncbi:shikimate kinase [Solitalea koreensis]|uniref:Shikimate kinase n=1 Tax=Solitalea koreensis TaxID=543615 RepID=A0A521CH31_9SPHI|nr:shikimate kinase [Solitalea koreensis]SMO58734.1 Shikimate kinase [Solitalea koreensis]
MNNKTVILTGFSTAGKSHYLREICKINLYPIYFLDSDKFVSKEFDGHIYNIFMKLGREDAIRYIETKEQEFIQHLSDIKVPTLVAAGPFLLIRDGWDNYVTNFRPQIIYLKKSLENIHKDLSARKADQKNTLDVRNPNFGSWDLSVTTEIKDGTYQDIPDSSALANIKEHLTRIVPIYEKFAQETYDSDQLRNNADKSNALTSTIIEKLR